MKYCAELKNINEDSIKEIKDQFEEWFQTETKRNWIKLGHLFNYVYTLTYHRAYLSFGGTTVEYSIKDDMSNNTSMFPSISSMICDINDIALRLAVENNLVLKIHATSYRSFIIEVHR